MSNAFEAGRLKIDEAGREFAKKMDASRDRVRQANAQSKRKIEDARSHFEKGMAESRERVRQTREEMRGRRGEA